MPGPTVEVEPGIKYLLPLVSENLPRRRFPKLQSKQYNQTNTI